MSKTPEILKIDPNGDTLFILRSPDAAFAADSTFELWPRALPQYWTDEQQQNENNLRLSALAAVVSPKSTSEIQMQLSSKHLALASTYFQKMMANDWKESKAENGYAYTITADDWNPDALIILMNIIHGQTQKVPKTVDVEKLAKIAVLVDYYKCHKAMHWFADVWISRLAEPLHMSYSRDILLRLLVSHVFSDNGAFTKLTRAIVYESRGPIHTLGLPIPKELVDALESSRQQHISKFISSLTSLTTQLAEEVETCSFECTSMSLGALIKGMRALRLYNPQPTAPFNGYSVTALVKALSEIRTPDYDQLLRHRLSFNFNTATTVTTTNATNATNTTQPFRFGSSQNHSCGLKFKHKIQFLSRVQRAKIEELQLSLLLVTNEIRDGKDGNNKYIS